MGAAISKPRAATDDGRLAARDIRVTGRVQGVGFRPFVYALAQRYELAGWVRNAAGEVVIRVEGRVGRIAELQRALVRDAPPLARPRIAGSRPVAVIGLEGFVIEHSEASHGSEFHLPPDQFVCGDCLTELADPADRRFRHPFITCTQCGPRYTLIEALPYDRQRTSMAAFQLCPACRREYDDPADRRFHAEPLCCPRCGPRLRFINQSVPGQMVGGDEPALAAALGLLREGGILGVKGVGGYHLMCDAGSDVAVARLRTRKRRPDKPLAVMFATLEPGLPGTAHASLRIDAETERALSDPKRPIVLARRRPDCPLSDGIAPGLDEIGAMLPYSPLHHLLVSDFAAPLIATSGNISGEPVIVDPVEAERRLGEVCDAFLHHDRPIVRPADDPVLRVVAGQARPLRIGRGLAPLELELPVPLRQSAIALGGQMKVTVALGEGRRAVMSPHIGDLESPGTLELHRQMVADLPRLHGIAPRLLVCDGHPGYAGTRWALRQGLPVLKVQHHAAHASALAGEHPRVASWLVFTWDGVGYGEDGTLWGGEALAGGPGRWRRVASFRPFRPPGGDLAARAPWRSAAALMWQAGLDYEAPLRDPAMARLARSAWAKGINASATSAVGRLFDAAAALIMGLGEVSHEGQAAMQLEALAQGAESGSDAIALQIERDRAGVLRTDWRCMLATIADGAIAPQIRARIFHATMAAALVGQVIAVAPTLDDRPFAVGLTGGVFQNRLLAEDVIARLARHGIEAHLPMLAPANDGGLAYGQLVEAAAKLRSDGSP